MANRRQLLASLLDALIEHWGYAEVASALDERSPEHGSGGVFVRPQRHQKRHSVVSAAEQVARANVEPIKRAALERLAERFDQKQFLPTLADVRHFYMMLGQRPIAVKNRSDAFRRMLKTLNELPSERLSELASSELHSGPSELGLLSDAIASIGRVLPRSREPNK